MKHLKLAIAALATLSMAASAEYTTSTTTQTFSKAPDGSVVTSSKKTIITEKISDAEIQKQLNTKLDTCPDLNNIVSFNVDNGTVMLRGNVPNISVREHAEMVAKEIPGVVKVNNAIIVQ